MTLELAISVALATAFATLPFVLYMQCVRPSLRWHRARWAAQAVIGTLSVVPAATVAVGSESQVLALLAGFATFAVISAFLLPKWVIRLTGGPVRAGSDIDEILGNISPAGRLLDVGDVKGAQVQIDEARRRATAVTLPYVELWDAWIEDERKRRRGMRISRGERLEAIIDEYSRLVRGTDPIRAPHAIASVAVVAAVVMGGILVDVLR